MSDMEIFHQPCPDQWRRGVLAASSPAKTAARIAAHVASFTPRYTSTNGSTATPLSIITKPANIPNTAKQRNTVYAHCRGGSHGCQRCRIRSGLLNVAREK